MSVPSSPQLVKAVVDAFDLRIGDTEARVALRRSTVDSYFRGKGGSRTRGRILESVLCALREEDLLASTPLAVLDERSSVLAIESALDTWDALLERDPTGTASVLDLSLRLAGAMQLVDYHQQLDARWLCGDAYRDFFDRLRHGSRDSRDAFVQEIKAATQASTSSVEGWIQGRTSPTYQHLDELVCAFQTESKTVALQAVLQKLAGDLGGSWAELSVRVIDEVRDGFRRDEVERGLDMVEIMDGRGSRQRSDDIGFANIMRAAGFSIETDLGPDRLDAPLALLLQGCGATRGSRTLCLLAGYDFDPPHNSRVFEHPKDSWLDGIPSERPRKRYQFDQGMRPSIDALGAFLRDRREQAGERSGVRDQAKAAMRRREYGRALDLYIQVLKRSPDDKFALWQAFQCAIEAGLMRKARTLAERLDALGLHGPLARLQFGSGPSRKN